MAVYKVTNLDAWADGQIRSKIWLIKNLEPILETFTDPVIWQLAGWYAQLAFMLYIRDKKIGVYRSFDILPECEAIAEAINQTWLIDKWRFKAVTEDINQIDYSSPWAYHSPVPDIVINTSCEHMESGEWFDRIPSGKLIVLQSTDMDHSEHCSRVNSIREFGKQFCLSETLFSDELEIKYPSWSFKRFMLIGVK